MGDIFNKYECFGIDVSIVESKLDMTSGRKTIKRQDAGSPFDIKDPKVINADPFLFVYNDRLFLFYEETTFRRPGGRLMMVSTDDLTTWTEPVQISDDDSMHFSFPYVFEDENEVYMIPETGWVGEIRLYKAVSKDLSKFELDSVLMKRQRKEDGIIFDFADNVLYKDNGIYYLFTSILDSKGYELQLYISDSLKGPYRPHPSSPICHDSEYGRNAGSLIACNGRLYRPTQDCSRTYGGQVNVMEVLRMTPEYYEEKIFKKHILPSSENFYRQGGHQLNYAEFRGAVIMAADAKRDRAFPAVRIADKAKSIMGLKK